MRLPWESTVEYPIPQLPGETAVIDSEYHVNDMITDGDKTRIEIEYSTTGHSATVQIQGGGKYHVDKDSLELLTMEDYMEFTYSSHTNILVTQKTNMLRLE